MKRPLGCFSGIGVVAALATLLVVGVVTATAGGGWFSPGALSAVADGETYGGVRSHAEIGGDCTLCHAPPWSSETMADRCTGCHAELRQAGSLPAEFHRLLRGEGPEQPCRGCHPEHRGRGGRLTEMSATDFPHAFPFDHGGGGPSECRTCHPDGLVEYTCYGCHEHTPAEIQREHAEEGIRDVADCVKCHPTGQEEEGEGRGGDD